jgi:hypothetical protein
VLVADVICTALTFCSPASLRDVGVPEFASQPGLRPVEAESGVEVEVVAGLEQEESGDQMWVAADDAELATELLFRSGHVTRTPSPLRCGRLAYNMCRMMRISRLPGIKFVFLKELSLNSSSD